MRLPLPTLLEQFAFVKNDFDKNNTYNNVVYADLATEYYIDLMVFQKLADRCKDQEASRALYDELQHCRLKYSQSINAHDPEELNMAAINYAHGNPELYFGYLDRNIILIPN